jgi:putative endonuclease
LDKKNSQKLGRDAEKAARDYLEQNGYNVLETNWRFRKYELDIIAKEGETMVFIEVKARSTDEFGEPEIFVNRKKQRFMVAAADFYIQERDIPLESRFDVIALLPINDSFTIKHIKDAFYPALK